MIPLPVRAKKVGVINVCFFVLKEVSQKRFQVSTNAGCMFRRLQTERKEDGENKVQSKEFR